MNKNIWSVYIHIVPMEVSHLSHDKYYVGITKQTINRRWRENGAGYKTQNFWKVIQKYGWDNIVHKIISEGLTKKEACQLEQYYISLYKSNLREYGYNLTSGGDGHFEWSEESRQKMSESRKGKYCGENSPLYGRKCSEEHIKNMRLHHADFSGEKNPNYGKHTSDETKKRMSESLKGKLKGEKHPFWGKKRSDETRKKIKEHHADIHGVNNPNSIAIKCTHIETNQVVVYQCITQAGKNLHLDRNKISEHLKQGTIYRGYLFERMVS